MVEPAYLDWLDATVRCIRKTHDKAFGGDVDLLKCDVDLFKAAEAWPTEQASS